MDSNDSPLQPEDSIDQQPPPGPPPRPTREELIGALADEMGWTPEQLAGSIQLRSEYERAKAETDRRIASLEQREREIEEEREQARFRYQVPEFADPGTKMMYEMFMEERAERKREREEKRRLDQMQAEVARQGEEIRQAYEQQVSSLPSHKQIPLDQFVNGGLEKLYPRGIPTGLSPMQAVRNTFQFMGLNGGYAPGPQLNGRGPRATITIPGASSSQPPSIDDSGPQRPGESLEEFVLRRRRWASENNVRTTPERDGVRYVIE